MAFFYDTIVKEETGLSAEWMESSRRRDKASFWFLRSEAAWTF